MGLTRTVRYPAEPPAWAAVAKLLTAGGYPVRMGMIDGELAFPDEEPAEPWRELRLNTPGGTVTLRRGPDRIDLVVWGNAAGELLQGWNALAWACAAAGDGVVVTEAGDVAAADFLRTADLPDALRK